MVIPSKPLVTTDTKDIGDSVDTGTLRCDKSWMARKPESGAYSNGRSSLLPILMLTAECIRLSNEVSLSRERKYTEGAHYPRPSRPENDLLISSSFKACIRFATDKICLQTMWTNGGKGILAITAEQFEQ